mgnify:CR=1 FL=1
MNNQRRYGSWYKIIQIRALRSVLFNFQKEGQRRYKHRSSAYSHTAYNARQKPRNNRYKHLKHHPHRRNYKEYTEYACENVRFNFFKHPRTD